MTDRNIKFLVDEMHSKLCTWLRLLGFDSKGSKDYEEKYGKSVMDKYLIIEALEEGRVLLTGDKQMYEIIIDKSKRQHKVLQYKGKEIPHAVKIKQDTPINQLISLHTIIPLDYELNFNEMCCSVCGGKNKKVEDKKEIKDKVLESVYNEVNEFWICSKCNKIFWIGSQTKHIIETYNKLISSLNDKIESN
ncbi:hypothetical protein EHI8A_122940 [Entamoeba histolytica HM-1:IMSS-B]|uniref:Mut7-C RNAse domain-containing protein n=6 Tax=Entamoeba histolytica TaxID=5759 RepID=C4LXS0_ENTH1|nr:hypothetical protein EHI_014340 [Entamoeba histolytica HM-1:IMSS]EMD45202.1 Hypothetical protein EHI5A_148410 [Entamoeba histolytica KU27]EMH75466.1 hypothetical protein EHI8A_122940 [Entamoeba histolytica HM-1:IMSS-B]EMS16787.1 hypothetical protein KM1_181500 [Entamoeba histolytica HM-3:IMSS]ENY60083.1 hypothetical protein EHI7A_113550 [Entamoeba histolytica HM-1:IMSS-A]GAT93564.1 hypothetical protein CL6EHI_014340 [Entamoeba histolytica]|eukprot:XP_655080.2 hypothetical protein EHI_014340 [Entamoeba histolytica HM-1:IMSS]